MLAAQPPRDNPLRSLHQYFCREEVYAHYITEFYSKHVNDPDAVYTCFDRDKEEVIYEERNPETGEFEFSKYGIRDFLREKLESHIEVVKSLINDQYHSLKSKEDIELFINRVFNDINFFLTTIDRNEYLCKYDVHTDIMNKFKDHMILKYGAYVITDKAIDISKEYKPRFFQNTSQSIKSAFKWIKGDPAQNTRCLFEGLLIAGFIHPETTLQDVEKVFSGERQVASRGVRWIDKAINGSYCKQSIIYLVLKLSESGLIEDYHDNLSLLQKILEKAFLDGDGNPFKNWSESINQKPRMYKRPPNYIEKLSDIVESIKNKQFSAF